MASANDRSLRSWIESLPQELFEMIVDCVFVSKTNTHHICAGSRYPPLLHVSREFWNRFASKFYSRTFAFDHSSFGRMLRWIGIVLKEHLDMIRVLRLEIPFPSRSDLSRILDDTQTWRRFFLVEIAEMFDGKLVLEFKTR